MRKVASLLCLLVVIALSVWVGVIFRFSHPEMTETQLTLANWPLLIVALIALVLSFVLRWP